MSVSSTSSTPVLIVGAGPTGLMLALTLAKNGVPFRIIDRVREFHKSQRGCGIQPRTQEIWSFFEVLPDILNNRGPSPPMRLYKLPGGVEPIKTYDLVPRMDPTPAIPYPNPIFIGQNLTEAVLRSHLEKLGHRVELCTELRGFEQHSDRVTVHLVKTAGDEETSEDVDCHWLVGSDGGKSIVRKHLGLDFVGEVIGGPMLTGEIEVTAGLSRDYWHSWRDAGKIFFLRPTETEGVFNFMLGSLQDRVATDRDSLIKAMQGSADRTDIIFGEIKTVSEYRPNARMVSDFAKGRVFLAGDAAHVHSPTGGQGLNTSVQDAVNLAWKLVLVEKGLASASLLSTYTTERQPVIADMLQMTTKIFENNRAGSEGSRPHEVKQLGVNYRWSPIVLDERAPSPSDAQAPGGPQDTYGWEKGGALRAGERAPDAPGLASVRADPQSGADTTSTSLFRTFAPTHHAVLIFSADGASVKSIVDALKVYPADAIRSVVVCPQGTADVLAAATAGDADLVLVDGEGHAYTGYGASKEETTVVVVRPDGFVGAIVKGVEGLNQYFKLVFSALAA